MLDLMGYTMVSEPVPREEPRLSSSHRYPIPAGEFRVEEEIQRSRFLTTAAPAETVAEAQSFIQRIREEFADATHNCWAYLVGRPGSSGHVGMSDDGEPHGTAGRPMLNVLSHCPVGDIAVVVTRYYGGTKLGKGGLVRAYGGGVQLVLADLPVVEKVYRLHCRVVIDYSHIKSFQRLATEYEVQMLEEQFEVDATFDCAVPHDFLVPFTEKLESLTNGAALWELLSENEIDA